ncbi:MAG: type 1 glutamine amidotransferase [Paracoccaceae bacterium]
MKIGILLCGHAQKEIIEKYGDYIEIYPRLLEGFGFEFVGFNVVDMEFPDSIHDADGWLLTGSRFGVYDDVPFIAPLEQFIRDAYAAKVPMVGICFGHQLIAQALGGKVEKYEGGWAIGPTDYAFEGGGNVILNAWHQDQVITPPEGAKTIASNSFCKNAALIYDNRILTVQPHPEFNNPILRDYVSLRRDLPEYPDEIMAGAQERLKSPTDETLIAGKIADFFKQSRDGFHV